MFGAAGYLFYWLHSVENVAILPAGATALVVAALFGVAIDRVIYLPVLRRGGGSFSVFIASLGVALLFESLALLVTHGTVDVAHTGAIEPVTFAGLTFRWLDVIVVVTIAIVYAVLYFAIMRTDAGLEIRALADNAPLAGVVGIDTGRTRTVIFVVASALAGLGGIFTAYDSGIVPTTGINLLFITMVAVLFGGTRLLFLGTLGGSIVMGLVTALAGFFAPAWVTVIVFALLIIVLIARPQGLFG